MTQQSNDPAYFNASADSDTKPNNDPHLELIARFDGEHHDGGSFLGRTPEGDLQFEFVVQKGMEHIYIEGSGGGGGGGGGASGRGDSPWGPGGGGAGGNGSYSPFVYGTTLKAGDKLLIQVGHGGAGGQNAVGTDQFGCNGQPGSNSFVRLGTSQIFTFYGAAPGEGGTFSRGGDAQSGGLPGKVDTGGLLSGYTFVSGGAGGTYIPVRAAGQSAAGTTPRGGARGEPGTGWVAGAGGGGGQSMRGNGGTGGPYAGHALGAYGRGTDGVFGAGGGGGAGGGHNTSDDGGLGGRGGDGYVWIYRVR